MYTTAKELQSKQTLPEERPQEIYTTSNELLSTQKAPETVYREVKPVENTHINPSGLTQNPPTLFNPSFSMPTINTNSADNAFLAFNYGMQSNFLTSQLNFNHNTQAMQQSYNQSTQSLQQSYNNTTQAIQQAYLAYLTNIKH
jgi:hypothetical protein